MGEKIGKYTSRLVDKMHTEKKTGILKESLKKRSRYWIKY